MDKIKALEDKFNDQYTEETLLALCKHISDADAIKKREKQLEALNFTLDALKNKLASSEESLNGERLFVNSKVQELLELKGELKELQTSKNNLLDEILTLEKQKEFTKNKKISNNDQQILEHGKKKLQLYKDLTGIKWDFAATPNVTPRGYVTNGKDRIHSFSYHNKESRSKLRDLLWADIEKSTKQSDTEEEN